MDIGTYCVHLFGIILIAVIPPLAYYSLRMMRFLKGGVAWKYITVGFLFYIPRVTLSYFLDIYPSYLIVFESFRLLLSATITFFIFMGIWILWTNFRQVGISLLKISTMRYFVAGLLIFTVGLLWRTACFFYVSLNTPFIWVLGRMVLLVGIVISIVCLRKICWAVSPAAAAGGKDELLLRDDIRLARAYTDLTSRFLVTVVSMIGVAPVKEILGKSTTTHDILRGCKITDDGVLKSENLVENIKRIDEKDALPKLSNAFSTFTSKIIGLYDAATSPKLANETFTRIYRDTKENYKSLEMFSEIVKELPEGVLEDEKLKLATREDLEQKVLERTKELERTYEARVKAEAAAAAADKARLEESEKARKSIEERAKKLEDSRSAMIYLLEDISRTSKQLEEAKTHTENIMRSIADTLLVVNPEGKISMANKALSDILGYDEKEIIGKSVDKIFASPKGGAAAAAAAAAAADRMFRGAGLERLIKEGFVKDVEITYLTKKGKEIHMSFSGSVMRDEKGKLAGIVCVAKDLSEIKKVVEETEKYSKKLKKAYDKLKTLDKMKSDFLSMAAHELRTPLTPVKTYVEMMMDRKYGWITSQQKEKLRLIDKSIDRLRILIDDMLNITKIEAGKLEAMRKPLSIGEIVDTALDEALSLFGERKHRITIDVPDGLPLVYADEKLIGRVVSNLLNNAMKYTPARGKITVTAKSEGKNIHITVADTGTGIPKKEQTKIFEKFYVSDIIHTSRHKGIGLGLAIAKGIVKAHNGKIWVESKGLGEGSTFHVLLPVMEKEK